MRLQRIAYLLAATLVLGLAAGCDKKKENGDDTVVGGVGSLVMHTMVPNPDGTTGSAYIQMVDPEAGNSYDNANTYQVGYGNPGTWLGKYLVFFPDYGKSSEVKRFTVANGRLQEAGVLQLEQDEAPAWAIMAQGNKAYFASHKGRVTVVDMATFTKTGTIDITQYANKNETVAAPTVGCMFAREGKVYIPITQMIGQSIKGEPVIELLVVDVATDKIVGHINEKVQGIGALGVHGKTLFTDEQGDAYLVAGGGMGMLRNFKSGIVRMKKGEDKIDPSWVWPIQDELKVDGDGMTWLHDAVYMGNGILYVTALMDSKWNPQDFSSYMTARAVALLELNLRTKTAKRIPTPYSTPFSGFVGKYGQKVIVGVEGTEKVGFYTYDPATQKVSDGPVVECVGMPFAAYEVE